MVIQSLRVVACVGLTLSGSFVATSLGQSQVPPHSAATERIDVSLRGALFVANEGQWSDTGVRYGFRTRGLDVAFRESSLRLHVRRPVNGMDLGGALLARPHESGGTEASMLAIDSECCGRVDADLQDAPGSVSEMSLVVSFPGSNVVQPIAARPQATTFNYYIGDHESAWRTAVPSFASIVYPNLYDGVDLHVLGSDGGVLKYEFHVAPGANWSNIRVRYSGVDSLNIGVAGELQIHTALGTLTDSAPVVWQDVDGERQPIRAHFDLLNDQDYRIALEGEVDAGRELIIDPDVDWMTYYGGSINDEGWSVAVDSEGSAVAAGYTESANFEGQGNAFYGGSFDAFALKVDAAGNLVWMTFLGGAGADFGKAVTVDSDDNALVAGYTKSTDFAGSINTPRGGSIDTFALKISPSGSLLWMTYLGGTVDDWVNDIAVDAAGSARVAGQTSSRDFTGHLNATHGGSADAYVVKVSPSGATQWMVYLGGSGWDSGRGVAVDQSGNTIVSGRTESTDFEGRRNAFLGGQYDAFVVKLGPSGSLWWMNYIGGSEWDSSGGVAINGAGDVFPTGYTLSTDCLRNTNSNHGDVDGYVMKFNPLGDLQWMTYLGGTGGESCAYIAIDSAGNSLMTGRSASLDFEGSDNSQSGAADAFIVKVNPQGAQIWMSYLGGRALDYGRGIAVDAADDAFVAGFTASPDFAGRSNANHGGEDVFVTKIHAAGRLRLAVIASCPSGGPIQIDWAGGTPGGEAVLFYSAARGAFQVPGGRMCAGTYLGLSGGSLRVVFQGAIGSQGRRTLNSTAAGAACGGYLQLLDVSSCDTSNVARIE